MASFLADYEDATNTIDNVVSTQLSSVMNWTNIPGNLSKVVSSSAGFAWGYGSSANVWICQLPCSGNWSSVDISKFGLTSILDIVTDNTTVYVLGLDQRAAAILLSAPASNTGTFTGIKVGFDAKEIFSTHSFVWAQDSSNAKQRCAKPCTMANWTANPDVSIKITSSSDSSLYGIDSKGTAMKSDEGLQTGWSPISDLAGVQVEDVIGDADTLGLYGLDKTSTLFKVQNGSILPQPTQGYSPSHLSIDPVSKQMWMTSDTPGQYGNIFTKLENPDYSTITNTIQPLDKKRDEIVSDVTKEYNTQTQVMTVNKQVNDVVTYFKKMFNLDRDTGTKGKVQAAHLEEQIRSTQVQLDLINKTQPLIQKFLILLAIVAAIYIVGTFLGWVLHIIATVVLIGGAIYILKFS